MTDILSLDAAKQLKVNIEGFDATINPKVVYTQSAKSRAAMKKLAEEIDQFAPEIAKSPKLQQALKDALPQLKVLGLDDKHVTRISEALSLKAVGTEAGNMAALVGNPLARKMIDDKDLGHKFKISNIEKLDDMIASKDKIAELAKDGIGKNKAAIRAELVKHVGNTSNAALVDAMITDAKGKIPAGLADITTKISTDFTEIFDKVKVRAQAVVSAEAAFAKASGKKAEKVAQKELDRAVKQFQKLGEKSDLAGQAFEHLEKKHPKLFEAVKDAHPEAASHIESTIKDGAKAVAKDAAAGRGFFKKLFDFKFSKEYLTEQAAAKKINYAKAVETIGKEGALRWGKIAGGAGVVIGSALAASAIFGNKDKESGKSFTEAEMKRRAEGERAAGASVA